MYSGRPCPPDVSQILNAVIIVQVCMPKIEHCQGGWEKTEEEFATR